jgi:4-diphosphocytidyl-2-C-methyl-D-erythritol kinase
MDKVQVCAHAKTNLVLRVLDKELSGFHNLETLFVLLDLHDFVTVERRDHGITVDVEGANTGLERENLAYKAAESVLRAASRPFGVHIHIQKSIPVQAGLGGGSSDGAATLHAVNLLADSAFPLDQVFRFAADLGSDVPFFASRVACAIGRGRGDRIIDVEGPNSAPALVVMPSFGVSTREAYELLSASRRGAGMPHSTVLSNASFSSWAGIVEVTANDFEEVLFRKEAKLHDFFSRLVDTGPLLTRLCGSGSAMIAVYTSVSARDAAKTEFPDASRVIPTRIRDAPAPGPEPV